MDNKNTNGAKTQKEEFTEPTCELVSFSFENVMAEYKSLGDPAIILPEDTFD